MENTEIILTGSDNNQIGKIEKIASSLNSMSSNFESSFGMLHSSIDKITEVYRYSQDVKLQLAKINAAKEIQLKKTAASFQLCRQILDGVFGERQIAIKKSYEILDAAIESNDREMMLASLQQITNIVTSNPLQSLTEFVKVINNPDETLYLDF